MSEQQSLNFDANFLEDETIVTFSSALSRNPHLTALYLSRNAIGSAGIKAVADLVAGSTTLKVSRPFHTIPNFATESRGGVL